MKEKYLIKRRALLHRQAAELSRNDAAYQDASARELDGELSAVEKKELSIRLKWLTAIVERSALEYRIARLNK